MRSEKDIQMDSQSHINKPEINILLMKYVARGNWGRAVHPDPSGESFSSVCLVNSFETLHSAQRYQVVRMKQRTCCP